MTLDNFKIVIIDKLNVTFEEYKEVESKKDKSISYKWIRVGGYYHNLKVALEKLKDYIIQNYINIDDYKEVLNKINELNNSIVKCEIRIENEMEG